MSTSSIPSHKNLPQKVRLVEVGPRDGLQNEPEDNLTTQFKIELIDKLSRSGLKQIEVASFVSPKWVPQMADSAEVLNKITRRSGTSYAALTPNYKGVQAAIKGRADQVAVFSAASEEFTQRNINCSIAESLRRFESAIEIARQHNLPVRGYISTVVGCPYSGDINPEQVASVCRDLFDMGCYEISLGDTVGVGTPLQVKRMLEAVVRHVPITQLAMHFHDTYGQALANIYAGLEESVTVIDTSIAGLGGCPYAHGASGNVATEDVLYMLHGLGIETGVDLDSLVKVSHWLCKELNRPNGSKVSLAYSSETIDI